MQASVLVFVASVQYRLIALIGVGGDDPIPVYGFYILLFGTLLLAIRVFLCARIVERNTEEFSGSRMNRLRRSYGSRREIKYLAVKFLLQLGI